MRQRGFSLIVYAVLALAALGALGGIYWNGYSSGSAAVKLEWQAANAKARAEEAAKGQASEAKLEDSRAKTKILYRTIKREVEKVVDRPVYLDRCLDDDGLRLANCAILGKSADSCKPDKPVPGATPADGWDRARYLALDYGNFRELPGLH